MRKSDSRDFEIDRLERELLGVQEMLAFVLYKVGEPVVVTKEELAHGLGENVQIVVDDDLKKDAFVFSLSGLND